MYTLSYIYTTESLSLYQKLMQNGESSVLK